MQSKALINTDKDTDNHNKDLENWRMMKILKLCLMKQGRENKVDIS